MASLLLEQSWRRRERPLETLMGIGIGEDAIEKGLILAARQERRKRALSILKQKAGDDLGIGRVIGLLAELVTGEAR